MLILRCEKESTTVKAVIFQNFAMVASALDESAIKQLNFASF